MENHTNGCAHLCKNPIHQKAPSTVGEHLDMLIAGARKQLEDVCIRKAKAEAAGLLNYPLDDMRKFVGW
jgi:hypothetical protein